MPDLEKYPWSPEWSETVWDNSLDARLSALSYEVFLPEPHPPAINLALDETLLYKVAAGDRPPLLRFWEWTERSIILGSYQSVMNEIDAREAHVLGFGFERRISGGGAMVVEPEGAITWSLIVPEHVVDGLSFVQSFAFLDRWCVRVLRSIGIPAVYRPVNDIVSPSGKIGGAAQCRRRKTVLHHATMAYSLDNEAMFRLLRLNRPTLTDRGIRSAVKTVSSLSDFTARSRTDIRDELISGFSGMFSTAVSAYTDDERREAGRRVEEKFSSSGWKYRVP